MNSSIVPGFSPCGSMTKKVFNNLQLTPVSQRAFLYFCGKETFEHARELEKEGNAGETDGG